MSDAYTRVGACAQTRGNSMHTYDNGEHVWGKAIALKGYYVYSTCQLLITRVQQVQTRGQYAFRVTTV